MNRVYISERGNDKNDGRTPETPVYSWERALKLCDGNTEAHLMDGPTLEQLIWKLRDAHINPLGGVEAAATGQKETPARCGSRGLTGRLRGAMLVPAGGANLNNVPSHQAAKCDCPAIARDKTARACPGCGTPDLIVH